MKYRSKNFPIEANAYYLARKRCNNPNNEAYAYYGGRGITFDPAMSFHDFVVALGGPRPSKDHSLDPIDGSRGYEAGNIRWATRAVQSRNRSMTRWYTAAGHTLCLTDWAVAFDLPPSTLASRLDSGMNITAALWTPVTPGRNRSKPEPLDPLVAEILAIYAQAA